jgi:nicotinate-nucleotide adenylyltransferase
VAQAAAEELELDRVHFIPAARSPFKLGVTTAPANARLQLLRLALVGRSCWVVDDQEIRRGGISYAIDTLRNYAQRFPGARLFYLIGADHVPSLSQWREAAELARMAEFAVISRPGELPAAVPPPFIGIRLRGFALAVSSSQIRERVKSGLPIEPLVPAAVAEAIRNNRLYL